MKCNEGAACTVLYYCGPSVWYPLPWHSALDVISGLQLCQTQVVIHTAHSAINGQIEVGAAIAFLSGRIPGTLGPLLLIISQ